MRRAPAILSALLLAAPAVAEAPVSVVAVASVAQPFEDRITLRGRTEAPRRVELRAELSGLIVSEPIRKGTLVAAGDPLCRIDPGGRPAALTEARAALREAEAQYEAAIRLAERGFTAETETLTRGARLEAARAGLMRAEMEMDRLVIAAPFDGALESDTAERGALMQPGSLCAELIALDPIALVGFIAERDVERLERGATARARLVTGRLVEGEVSFVARSADPETRTYRVEIEAPNPDLAVRDGMTAEIMIPVEAQPAHLLPQSALTLDDEGRLGVRLAVEGRARFAPVTILSDAAGGVWLGGLPERADVIVVGQEFVSDGNPVEVRYADETAIR